MENALRSNCIYFVMILQIANWKLKVGCGEIVAEVLQNLKPFLISENSGDVTSLLCRLELKCALSAREDSPDVTNVLNGRQVRIWLTPEHCHLALTPLDSQNTYWLCADRQWRHVETDLRLEALEEYEVLNHFIMISFIYSSAFAGTVLIHASCIAVGDEGVAFVGPSGIGKSTHSQLWLKYIPGTWLLNDDQPVLRVMPGGEVMLFGSPWSGKTPCYNKEGVRLKSLFYMEQAEQDSADRLTGIRAFRVLLGVTSLIGRDGMSFAAISSTLVQISGIIPAFILRNKPEKEAAELSYSIFRT